jgi:hypothetical protein
MTVTAAVLPPSSALFRRLARKRGSRQSRAWLILTVALFLLG